MTGIKNRYEISHCKISGSDYRILWLNQYLKFSLRVIGSQLMVYSWQE